MSKPRKIICGFSARVDSAISMHTMFPGTGNIRVAALILPLLL